MERAELQYLIESAIDDVHFPLTSLEASCRKAGCSEEWAAAEYALRELINTFGA